jgi:hypothetical protein
LKSDNGGGAVMPRLTTVPEGATRRERDDGRHRGSSSCM